MTEETRSIFITDTEAYLNGDRDYSLTIYSTKMFTEDNTPENWVYLGEIESPESPSREKLLEIAVAKLDIEDDKIIAETEVRRKAIDARRQRLLALPHKGVTHV